MKKAFDAFGAIIKIEVQNNKALNSAGIWDMQVRRIELRKNPFRVCLDTHGQNHWMAYL